jgi:transposase-like protein
MPRGDNNRRLSDEDRAEVVRRYTTRLADGTWAGSGMIAQDFGVNRNTIMYVLKRAGVTMRDSGEAHAHGKRCGPIKHTAQLDQPPLCACGCGNPTHWARADYRWAKYCDGHYRSDAPYKSREWLFDQYVTQRHDAYAIARQFGVNVSTIIKFMKKYGIDRRDAVTSHIGTQAGANNPAWKGGVTPERQRLYKTQEWKALLKSVYARDAFKCQRCQQGVSGKGKRAAAAHHIKSWGDYPELRRELSNLVTLCRVCHLWVHSLANVDHDYLGDHNA